MSSLRSRMTFANVVSVLALFIALGSGASAAGLFTGKDVKDGSLTGADVRDNSLRSADISDGNLLAKDFKPGQLPAGPQGPKGDAGPAGAQGAQGIQGPIGETGPRGETGAGGTGAPAGAIVAHWEQTDPDTAVVAKWFGSLPNVVIPGTGGTWTQGANDVNLLVGSARIHGGTGAGCTGETTLFLYVYSGTDFMGAMTFTVGSGITRPTALPGGEIIAIPWQVYMARPQPIFVRPGVDTSRTLTMTISDKCNNPDGDPAHLSLDRLKLDVVKIS